MTTDERRNIFISKAKIVHSGENLDYSEVVYIDNRTPVKIIDHDLDENGNEYGPFYPLPCNFLNGQGHPGKRGKKISNSKRSKQEDIIRKFEEVHKGENLDYSLVEYVNMHTKVKIICHDLRPDGTEYGEFWQEPCVHLKGCTHPELSIAKRKKCNGGCSSFFMRQNKTIVSQIIEILNPLIKCDITTEYDIFMPSKNLAIEIIWANKDHNYHYNKMMKAREKGIYLLQIFEDEYLDHKEIVIDKIFNALGLQFGKEKINARDCEVVSGSGRTDEIVEFFNKNHIQGYAGNTLYYNCIYKGSIVGSMLFTKDGDMWNLVRFCTDNRYLCRGVASKLFKHFISDVNPKYIKSFLDRRWSHNDDDNLYTKLGFKIDEILKPDYRYTKGNGERIHKFNFRKKVLLSKYGKEYGLTSDMTETEMSKILGYGRIWDCGLIRYVWTPKSN